MRMTTGDDRSELERELELYLERELEAGVLLTIRVLNTEKVDTTVTFRDDGNGAVTITIVPGQVIALTGVRRNKDCTAVAGTVKDLPTDGKPYTGFLRMDIQETQFVVAPAKEVWGFGVQPVPGFARRYAYQEAGTKDRIVGFIKQLAGAAQMELEAGEDDDLDDDELDDREWGRGSRARAREFEEVRQPTRVIDVDDLQDGDIIVSTTRHPLSGVIRAGSRSKVSHAVLSMGDGKVMEALAPEPLGYKPVEEAIADDKYAYALRYPGLTAGQRQAIRAFALQQWQLQKRFDVAGLVGTVFHRRAKDEGAKFFCSEFVLAAYAAAGISLFDSTQKRPGDIAELAGTRLTYIGHLKVTKRQARKLAKAGAGELEMDDDELELEDDDELEIEENDELEDDDELEEDEDLEDAHDEVDGADERELDAMEDPGVAESYARRLHEASGRSFESEADLDEALGRELEAVEDEYFVKRLRRRRRRRRGKGKGVFGKILKAGANIVGKIAEKTPIGSLVKAGTSLIRGDAKGVLSNLAKAAVGTALGPVAGTVATTAIDALGGEEGEVHIRRRRAVRRIARIARDTYRELADTLPEDYDHPLVANEVVRGAVRRAMVRNGVAPPRHRPLRRLRRRRALRRVIRVRPDQEIVLVGGR